MTVNGRQCLGKDQRRQPTAFNESTVYCLYLPPTECLFTTPHGPHDQGYRHAHRAHTILSVLGGRHAVKNEPGARSRYIGRGRQRLSRVDKLISYRKHYPAATSVTIPYASQPHYNSTTQRLAAYLLAGYRRRWSLSISSHYQITSFDVLIRPPSCIFLLFSYYYHRSCRQVFYIYDIHKYLIIIINNTSLRRRVIEDVYRIRCARSSVSDNYYHHSRWSIGRHDERKFSSDDDRPPVE